MTVYAMKETTVGVHAAKKRTTGRRKSLRPSRLLSYKVKRYSSVMSKKVTVKRTGSQGSAINASQAIAHASRCEAQLDAAIYRCLHALTKRHEPTEEFKAQFNRGAFIKPNTKAFIQVIHYLFNVYDAREFRKKFYWPILSKADENAFRSSTVEYVNSLIDRGKLTGITKIKAHVVVLPGGVKFMKFLLGLIHHVLQEELRKARGCATEGVITKKRIWQMIESHKRWTEAGNRIHEIVREEVALLSRNTEKIDALIQAILTDSDLAESVGYNKLMQLWAVLINTQFKEQQKNQQRTFAVAKEFARIIEKAENKLAGKELTLPFSREQLKDSLGRCTRQDPAWERVSQDVFDEHGKLNPINLLQLFELMLPSVEHFFANFCVKNSEIIKYEQKELSKVVVRLDDICQQLNVLQRDLPGAENGFLRDIDGNEESPELAKGDNFAIKNKLFCTPPIVMDFEGHSDDMITTNAVPGRGSQRLALLNKDDVQLMNARMKLLSTSVYQARSPRTQSTQNRMPPEPNQQLNPNVFAVPRVARKEKLNPLTMLDRIKAQSHKQTNSNGTRAGSSNPSAPGNSTMNISTLSEMTLRPEFSSTLLGTPEKPMMILQNQVQGSEETKENFLQIPLHVPSHHQVQRVVDSPSVHSSPRLMAIYASSTATPKSTRSPNVLLLAGAGGRRTSSAKRNSLVDNVSVHTSPSGRLEPVVKQGELLQTCEIQPALEEETTGTGGSIETGKTVLPDEQTLSPENGGQLVDYSHTLLANSMDTQITVVDAHYRPAEELSTLKFEEDNLFNVSDGILTDFE